MTSIKRIARETQNNYRGWSRSKSAVFWAVFYPILMIAIMGAVFGNTGNDIQITIGVQDLDNTNSSQIVVEQFNQSDELKVIILDSNIDVENWMLSEDVSAVLQIPKGFENQVNSVRYNQTHGLPITAPVQYNIYYDPSDSSGQFALSMIDTEIQSCYDLGIYSQNVYQMSPKTVYQEQGIEIIDFMLPGIIAVTILTNGVIGVVSQTTYDQKSGVIERLSLTPMRKFEYLLAKLIFQAFLALFIALITIITSHILWGSEVNLGFWTFAILIIGGITFASFGQLLAQWVRSPEAASAAASAITFPQMFLAGSFWPLEMMPDIFQIIAKFLPLTYFNDALRSAMIKPDMEIILPNILIVLLIFVISITLGAYFSKWDTE